MDKGQAQKKSGGIHRRHAYKITAGRAKAAGVMCLAIVLVCLLFISPLFNVRSIYVRGNNYLTSKEILDASGISKGNNIFAINTTDATRNIEKLFRVEKCEIERTLPGKVTLSITENAEKAYVKVNSGYAGIDENGRVMVLTKSCEMDCPLVSGVTAVDTQKGEFIKLEDENAKEKSELLIKILSQLSVRGMIPQVKTINIKDTEKISLTLVTKTLVNLGRDGEENKDTLEYKIAFLKAILDEDYPKNGGIIELSDTSNVTSRVS